MLLLFPWNQTNRTRNPIIFLHPRGFITRSLGTHSVAALSPAACPSATLPNRPVEWLWWWWGLNRTHRIASRLVPSVAVVEWNGIVRKNRNISTEESHQRDWKWLSGKLDFIVLPRIVFLFSNQPAELRSHLIFLCGWCVFAFSADSLK